MANFFQVLVDPPVFHTLPFKEMQKRRLFNRANLVGAAFCSFFAVLGIIINLPWLSYVTGFDMVMLFLAVYLNITDRFNLSRHVSFNASVLMFVSANYLYGSIPHTEIYLFAFAAVVILMFDDRRVIIGYCVYLLMLFLLCFYLQKHVIYKIDAGVALFSEIAFINYVFAFAGLSAILYSFKTENLENNQKIEAQKQIIEEKNNDLLDSIIYAKRLQDAILPPLSTIKQYLPQSFVLYKPKDIVAGDFYWMEKVGEVVLIAACDCTGHGVPGAMVSVVCSNALNRTVKEFKITEPGKILDKVRELVLETFEKSESDVQDGMDISLASITSSKEGIDVLWSGANNPLVYMEKNEIKELMPDKQPIGKFDGQKPFSVQTLKLQKGDVLYLFTDGYADQFGGPKGKKYKYKQLSDKLKVISDKPTDEQGKLLDTEFESWKGELDQVDDVLVIGIRI